MVRVLSRKTVEAMTTDYLTPEQHTHPFFGRGVWANLGFGYGVAVRTRRSGSGPRAGSFFWPGALATVHHVISAYNRLGVEAVETPGKGVRRHAYLSGEEEKQFLTPFFAQAQRGVIATVAQIQHAFEEKVGCEVDDSTIYRLLHSLTEKIDTSTPGSKLIFHLKGPWLSSSAISFSSQFAAYFSLSMAHTPGSASC